MESDVDSYIQGLNKALYDRYDNALFDWKWKENPLKGSFISIVVVEHKTDGPVAFNSFLPIEVRRGKEIFKVVQGSDGFVDSEHRRRGLFQKTIIFLEEQTERIDAEFLIGFNLVEAAGAAHKVGSEIAYDVNKCFIKPSKLDKNKDPLISLEQIDIKTLYDLYLGWAEKSSLFNINRSLNYLIWRNKHPFKINSYYDVKIDGKAIGYIITDKIIEKERTILTINDYNPGMVERYLGDIVQSLCMINDDITVIEVDTLHGSEGHRQASKIGFEILPWYRVIMKALHGAEQRGGDVYRKGLKLSDVKNWHFSESDIY